MLNAEQWSISTLLYLYFYLSKWCEYFLHHWKLLQWINCEKNEKLWHYYDFKVELILLAQLECSVAITQCKRIIWYPLD